MEVRESREGEEEMYVISGRMSDFLVLVMKSRILAVPGKIRGGEGFIRNCFSPRKTITFQIDLNYITVNAA